MDIKHTIRVFNGNCVECEWEGYCIPDECPSHEPVVTYGNTEIRDDEYCPEELNCQACTDYDACYGTLKRSEHLCRTFDVPCTKDNCNDCDLLNEMVEWYREGGIGRYLIGVEQ